MSTFAVLKFKTEVGAPEVLNMLEQLHKQGKIQILDAAVLVRKQDGKPKIEQLHNLVGVGALGGAFWGMLIGLLFRMPWLGAAVGAASGALSGMVTDVGIDDKFIKYMCDKIEPGTSALFLLTQNAVVDRVAKELKGFDFDVTHTNRSKQDKPKLQETCSIEQAVETA